MDLRTSWARSDEDLPIKPTQQTEPAAIRERSKDTRRSLISLLACSSTSNPSHHTTTSYTSDRRRRSLWRAPGGWLRFTIRRGLPTVNLSHATSSLHSQMDVEVGESLSSEKQNRLDSLNLHALRLHNVNRLIIQSHDSLSKFAVSNGNGVLLKRRLAKCSRKKKHSPNFAYLTAKGLDRRLSLFSGHLKGTLSKSNNNPWVKTIVRWG